jgi:hypothetical protein
MWPIYFQPLFVYSNDERNSQAALNGVRFLAYITKKYLSFLKNATLETVQYEQYRLMSLI